MSLPLWLMPLRVLGWAGTQVGTGSGAPPIMGALEFCCMVSGLLCPRTDRTSWPSTDRSAFVPAPLLRGCGFSSCLAPALRRGWHWAWLCQVHLRFLPCALSGAAGTSPSVTGQSEPGRRHCAHKHRDRHQHRARCGQLSAAAAGASRLCFLGAGCETRGADLQQNEAPDCLIPAPARCQVPCLLGLSLPAGSRPCVWR